MVKVLYEDNHIIAVYKPAGILVQADDTGDGTLADEVKLYLKQKYNKLGKVWLGVVHRLDRPVSGIVLFGKTSKGAARLSEQIRNHTFKKIYHALVVHRPKNAVGTLVHFLAKNQEKNVVTVYDEGHIDPDALRAELSYETVAQYGRYTLLKINLKTGRPHQIRAQLSAIGCPIVGDVKYGASEPLPDKSLVLCATDVVCRQATTEEIISLHISVPAEWKHLSETYVA